MQNRHPGVCRSITIKNKCCEVDGQLHQTKILGDLYLQTRRSQLIRNQGKQRALRKKTRLSIDTYKDDSDVRMWPISMPHVSSFSYHRAIRLLLNDRDVSGSLKERTLDDAKNVRHEFM